MGKLWRTRPGCHLAPVVEEAEREQSIESGRRLGQAQLCGCGFQGWARHGDILGEQRRGAERHLLRAAERAGVGPERHALEEVAGVLARRRLLAGSAEGLDRRDRRLRRLGLTGQDRPGQRVLQARIAGRRGERRLDHLACGRLRLFLALTLALARTCF